MPNLLDWFLKLFNPRLASAQPKIPEDSLYEPAQVLTRKVLLLVYDPVVEPSSGKTLSRAQNWQRPADLVSGFLNDILKVSRGLVRYQLAERIDIDEFPAKIDGFRYTPQTYAEVLRGLGPPRLPQEVNYQAILTQHKILRRVASGEIDEVWTFSFPHAGFYESTMAGPGAFWCNAPPLKGTAASRRRFVIMGFSYERRVGEMHEAFCHRAESILEKTFETMTGEANLWHRFSRYDVRAPGKAACGTIHFAPNSVRDYDWNNPAPVPSECYDWLLNFPNFKGDIRTVNSAEWGSGDTRAHHTWWLNHLPRVAGRKNGIHNNWWQYVADPGRVRD